MTCPTIVEVTGPGETITRNKMATMSGVLKFGIFLQDKFTCFLVKNLGGKKMGGKLRTVNFSTIEVAQCT